MEKLGQLSSLRNSTRDNWLHEKLDLLNFNPQSKPGETSYKTYNSKGKSIL